MLLKELKLFEIDETPFADALSKASASIGGGRASTTSTTPKDIDIDLKPLAEMVIRGVNPAVTIDDSVIKKTLPTPESQKKAKEGVKNMVTVVQTLKSDFIGGIRNLDRVKKIATESGAKTVDDWAANVGNADKTIRADLTTKHQKYIEDQLEKKHVQILNALMTVNGGRKFSTANIEAAEKADKEEIIDKSAEASHTDRMKTSIEAYIGFLGALEHNIAFLERLIPTPKASS